VLMEQYANDKRVNIPYQLQSTTGTPIKFRISELVKKSVFSTLLSMSDNYVQLHCTMLFELILSLLLQSKETFCHLLVKCCQLLLVVICRSTNRTPLCTMSNFQCFHTSHTILWTLREVTRYLSSGVYVCPQVLVLHQFLPFVSCLVLLFSVAPSE